MPLFHTNALTAVDKDAGSYEKRGNHDDMKELPFNPIWYKPKRLPCSKNKVLVRLLTLDDMPLHLAEYQRIGPRSAVLAELHIHLHRKHEHVCAMHQKHGQTKHVCC